MVVFIGLQQYHKLWSKRESGAIPELSRSGNQERTPSSALVKIFMTGKLGQ
jgi:hypothetical protein